eukprot:evm.model.scf_2816.1 EVM.evm.TU.scf_2816.1   scf_2816:11238-11822(+)
MAPVGGLPPSGLASPCRRSIHCPAFRPSAHPVRHLCKKCAIQAMSGGPARSTVADTPLKAFLAALKPLGRVRLIATNDAAVLESVATFDGLFFATVPKGTYANIIDSEANLDMHLLLAGVGGARFEVGQSRGADPVPTYMVRVLGRDRETVVLTIFLMWDKAPRDVEEARVQAWRALKEEWVEGDGDTVYFEAV